MQSEDRIGGGISFSGKRGRVFIHKETIAILGYPKYIRFLFNPDAKKLAVQACDKNVPESFVVPKNNLEDWEFRICSNSLVSVLWESCKWQHNKTYTVSGTLYEEQRLVEFELDKGYIIAGDM